MGQPAKPIDHGLVSGQILLGKYRVESVLGHGGMGIVARCTHIALGEQVAIKMLRRDVLSDPDTVGRFMREAQAASKLKSEYVARVSDVGVFDDNVPYMVMEFLDGHDLDDLLTQRGVVPVAWAAEMMLQTCEALAEAHSHGIVHRDVKPSNLFVTWRPDGSALVKVLDFGISKMASTTDMQLTQTQSLLGTPAYMSPEQMRSARDVDARTDIWSLGTVLYELLEGRRPFEAESFSEMCVKVAVDEPSPMTNAPPALQHVVFRCLAKTAESRYPSVAELGRDLIPFATDAYQASMLVERMQRMLKRGADWDLPSSPSLPAYRPTPMPPGLRRAGTAPVVVATMPTREPTGPVAAAQHSLTQSSRPARRGPLVIGLSALVAVIVGAVVIGAVQNPAPARPALATEPFGSGATAAPASTTTPPTTAPLRATPATPPTATATAPATGPGPGPATAPATATATAPGVPSPGLAGDIASTTAAAGAQSAPTASAGSATDPLTTAATPGTAPKPGKGGKPHAVTTRPPSPAAGIAKSPPPVGRSPVTPSVTPPFVPPAPPGIDPFATARPPGAPAPKQH